MPKTAITTPFGLYEFVRMPFGLRNAAQSFQRFMDEVTRGLPFVYTYIDDLLIASETAEEHKQHLHTLFARLSEYGVIINPAKCVFGVSNLDFFGTPCRSARYSSTLGESSEDPRFPSSYIRQTTSSISWTCEFLSEIRTTGS